MTYRPKCDGLQAYSLRQKGYTYQIFMCNDLLIKTYLDQRMLPLHARVMAYFDTVEVKHYQCAMDDLYHLAEFFKADYNHEKIY